MISINDIKRVVDLAKLYQSERAKYERWFERSMGQNTSRQAQKIASELNWSAMALLKIEIDLHVAAVDAGLADLRDASHYGEQTFRPSGWHEYRHTPQQPRLLQKPVS